MEIIVLSGVAYQHLMATFGRREFLEITVRRTES